MRLYKRDYTKLTEAEIAQVKKANAAFSKEEVSAEDIIEIPKVFYIYDSYFPNNMLDVDIDDLKNTDRVATLTDKFESLVYKEDVKERDIIKFIKDELAYFIIGSLFVDSDFGHHDAYLFPEFPLSTNHIVDYLLVGKNSGGYEFIFVELEAVNENIVNADGSFGTSIRKGLQQIEDWDTWLDGNYSNLRSVFETYKNPKKTLPEEFHVLDKSRIHYVVISGRREHYKKSTYTKRRKKKLQSNTKVIHYNNLIDLALQLQISKHY